LSKREGRERWAQASLDEIGERNSDFWGQRTLSLSRSAYDGRAVASWLFVTRAEVDA
jgi:hypothetical protein